MRFSRGLAVLAVPVALVLSTVALAGCAADTGPTVVLTSAHSTAGTVVTDASGRAVYLYTKDQQHGTTTACDATCLASWPAVTTTSTEPQATGITAKVGEIPAAGGGYQLTLDGWPLYYFDGDTTAGMIKGQGIGGQWWLLAPDGSRVTDIGR